MCRRSNLPPVFLLGVGLTDLGPFGRYFGQNKEIASVFSGSVAYFNVGIGLTFLLNDRAVLRLEALHEGANLIVVFVRWL
jgi:hypothetical protein